MALPGSLNRYLLLMAQEHLEFRLPEIKSLLSVFGGQFTNSQETYGKSPFWILNIPSEDIARNLMKRTVCAKSIFELWGHGKSPEELYTSLKSYPVEKMVPYLHSDSTYKIKIHTFNKTLTQEEKVKRIDALEFLPFQGKVNLKKPQHVFSILEDYGLDPNSIPKDPHNIYFGRWIADGQRELIESYSVKKRHFIGNTSMDAGLSFIMTNHAKVKENDLVFDPFVGTGGLLIASAHFGAYVCGTDIDYNTVHGLGKASRKNQKWRGPDENIRANLRQYGLEKFYLDVLVSDASKPSWRKGTYFDAIITDPPYGIRESTRRSGSQKDIPKGIEKCPESHVPVSLSYHLSDMFFDLLNFAAETLVLGGRLVYWLPVYTPEYTEEMVPWHPCLRLISNCEQKLSSHTARRLITMEKVKEFEVDVSGSFDDTVYDITLSSISATTYSSPVSRTLATNVSKPGPPVFLAGERVGSAGILLSWNTPPNPNGRIISYVVKYKEVCPWMQTAYTRVRAKPDSLEVLLTNLNPGTTYEIKVAAENSAGIGVFSDPFLFQTAESGNFHK